MVCWCVYVIDILKMIYLNEIKIKLVSGIDAPAKFSFKLSPIIFMGLAIFSCLFFFFFFVFFLDLFLIKLQRFSLILLLDGFTK